jgi:hypothetical protein
MKMGNLTSRNLPAKIRRWFWEFVRSFWFKLLGFLYWRNIKRNPEKAYQYLPSLAPFLQAVPFFSVTPLLN